MKSYPIGSLTMFINISHDQYNLYNDELLNALKNEVHQFVNIQINNSDIIDVKVNTDVKWTTGCLIGTISLGVIVAGGGIIKFLKEYDKIRSGLVKLFEDFKNLHLIFQGKNSKKNVANSKNHKIKILKELPEEHKKYYETGNNIYFIESEVTSTHRITEGFAKPPEFVSF
jgi:hypothetical protein